MNKDSKINELEKTNQKLKGFQAELDATIDKMLSKHQNRFERFS